MITIFIIGFLFGFLLCAISVFGIVFYQYQKALKECLEEGWDMPN
jgi:hypothetical protein